jgi:hypothetical protein
MKRGSASSAKIGKTDFSLQKRSAVREISPLARGEEAYAASTAQAFEKSLTKTFMKLTKPVSLVYVLIAFG